MPFSEQSFVKSPRSRPFGQSALEAVFDVTKDLLQPLLEFERRGWGTQAKPKRHRNNVRQIWKTLNIVVNGKPSRRSPALDVCDDLVVSRELGKLLFAHVALMKGGTDDSLLQARGEKRSSSGEP
jgi:hypothetical protein